MTLSFKHPFVSGVPDNPGDVSAGNVVPSNWNTDHVLTMSTGYLLGRSSAGDGAVELIPQSAFSGVGSNMKYKTAAYTAVASDEILADTSAGPWTLTLPPTANQLDKIIIRDPKGTWVANNLTVSRNGKNIAGIADDLLCDVTQNIILIYIDVTTGWGVF